MFDPFDWRRFQPVTPMMMPPGTAPERSVFTVPLPTGGGPSRISTLMPPQGPAPSAPPARPPSMTMFQGLPLGPQTRETVIQPPPSVTVPGKPPIPLLGPGVANPSITGAPVTPTAPGTEFGNPATREALRTIAPGTTAKGPYDDLMAKVKNGDFNGALEQLASGMGGGGGAVRGSEPEIPRPQGPRLQPHQPEGVVDPSKLIEQRQQKNFQRSKRKRTQDKYDLDSWGIR